MNRKSEPLLATEKGFREALRIYARRLTVFLLIGLLSFIGVFVALLILMLVRMLVRLIGL